MSPAQSLATTTLRKKRLDRKKCVVCGAPRAGVTGYIYFESGRSNIGAPFCQTHLDNQWRYANPVFESRVALELFKKKHPQLYLRQVKDKPILFLEKSQTETATAV